MPRRLTAFMFALLLVLCALGGAQSASAAAEPFHVTDCLDLNPEQGLVYCFESRGVVQTHITPTERFVGLSRLRSSYTVLLNGEVIETGVISALQLEMAEGEISDVFQVNERTTFTYPDPVTGELVTCTDAFISVFANGEFRQVNHQVSCR
jgi:hypothetical protein